MAIDARVVGIREVDGRVKLTLEDRPGGGPAGQSVLIIRNPPKNWTSTVLIQLVDLNIWGGSSEIMLGEEKLASRELYINITLVDDWEDVIQRYRKLDAAKKKKK